MYLSEFIFYLFVCLSIMLLTLETNFPSETIHSYRILLYCDASRFVTSLPVLFQSLPGHLQFTRDLQRGSAMSADVAETKHPLSMPVQPGRVHARDVTSAHTPARRPARHVCQGQWCNSARRVIYVSLSVKFLFGEEYPSQLLYISHHLTIALHLSLCCERDVHESVFMSLSIRFLLMVPLNRGRVESRESALVA